MQANQSKLSDIAATAARLAKDSYVVGNDVSESMREKENIYDPRETARKIVDQALDQIIDGAVKDAKSDMAGRRADEINARIKDVVRAHKNAYFRNDLLIQRSINATSRQIEVLLEGKTAEIFGGQLSLGTFQGIVANSVGGLPDSETLYALKAEICKQIESALTANTTENTSVIGQFMGSLEIEKLTSDLTKRANELKNQLHAKIASGLKVSIAEQKEKIALFQAQNAEVEKQVKAYQQQLQEKAKHLQQQAEDAMQAAQNALVNEISKTIRIEF